MGAENTVFMGEEYTLRFTFPRDVSRDVCVLLGLVYDQVVVLVSY